MDPKLIEKYYRGECSQEEARKVMDWMNSQDALQQMENDFDRYWEESREHKNSFGKKHQQLWANFDKKSALKPGKERKITKYTLRKGDKNYGLKIAASILIVLSISFWFYQNSLQDSAQTTVASIHYTTITVPEGQKRTLKLKDGSTVILNAGSTLRFPEQFSDSTRQLHLTGEAFFEVVKDPSRPFMVHSGSLKTTALGTSFNIKAYRDENEVTVSLATGKVAVQQAKSSILLHPEEEVAYDPNTLQWEKRPFDPALTLAWKNGTLYFKDADFEEIFQQLSRWYGVHFEFKNRQKGPWQFTGKFHKEDLETVLQAIGTSKSFTYSIAQNNVLILFN
ncbi:FecR domain-containing protein [Rapidithrix thailandica]|uniref:FecR domain-containing protein n=1 Tax=Rapidithrix thailandica TaxID=413964 RepID=A0AAW9S284_9BACT